MVFPKNMTNQWFVNEWFKKTAMTEMHDNDTYNHISLLYNFDIKCDDGKTYDLDKSYKLLEINELVKVFEKVSTDNDLQFPQPSSSVAGATSGVNIAEDQQHNLGQGTTCCRCTIL